MTDHFAKVVELANSLELADPSVVEHVVGLIRGGRGADLDREIDALQEIALLLEPTSPLHAATERLIAAFRSADPDPIEELWPAWVAHLAASQIYHRYPLQQASNRRKSAGLVKYKAEQAQDNAGRDAGIYEVYLKLTASKSPGTADRAKKTLGLKHNLSPNTIRNIIQSQRKLANKG